MIVLDGLETGADRLEFAADGHSLLASSQNGPFHTVLWDLPAGGTPRLSWAGVREAAFCPDGERYIAISSDDLGEQEEGDRASSLRVIDPTTVAADPPFAHASHGVDWYDRIDGYGSEEATFVRRLRFAPDGTRFVVIDGPRRLRWWSWPALEAIDGPGVDPSLVQPGALAFSPDGRRLAVFDRRGEIFLLDAEYGTRFWDASVYSSRRPHVAYSPDGRWVAGASGSAMRVFDAASGERVAKVDFLPIFTGLAFTPDGRYLVSTHLNGRVEFLDTSTWLDGPTFDWKIGGLRSLAFSADGMLAAAGAGRRVVVWDLDL
jgi:WD40 repeat protein